MQACDKIKMYENMIEKIKRTQENIYFAMQLEASIKESTFDAAAIVKKVIVDRDHAEFLIERDWELYREVLKNDFAVMAKIHIVGYAIIICKESYFMLFEKAGKDGNMIFDWADAQTESELYAAQRILKIVRNALGHIRSHPSNTEAWGTWEFKDKKDVGIFEIPSMGVKLDTTKLSGQMFSWNQIGGIKSFIKVLDFVKNDLQERIRNLKC